MKILINYDLLDKIQETKTGFSLQRSSKYVLINSSICTLLWSVICIPLGIKSYEIFGFFLR